MEVTNLVSIKEENEDEVELQELFVFRKNSNGNGGVSDETVPKPLEKLHDMGPPPFLTKTYEMVENPDIDDIISWGNNGLTFVVWDPHKFSTLLLPKFFKHSNFSSFVRQLNTYGFRKVHFDQWEFANAAFRKDKKHLLKSIKRRNQCVANDSSRSKFQREIEIIEKLKLEQEELKATVHDLKQQLLDSEQSLATTEERLKCIEWKQKEFLLFIAKAMKNTPLFQQLLEKYKQKKCLENGQAFKRRKLASSESQNDDPLLISVNPNLDCCHEDGLVDLGTHSVPERSSSLTTSGTSSPDFSSGNYIMWEKLMEDDVICEDDEEEVIDANHTKFVHELQDLIAKPLSLGSLVNIGQVACPGGQ
ncbi:heat stress transcription factor A-7a-like [Silene latifolia]|uniref:heat stress transcription factor A-7a-like n=1 Tax=Silene latifolia TaxID=37657 RepID=UPI003D783107